MKLFTATFCALISCIAASSGATINLASGGIALKNKSGELLTGGAVRFGWFSTYSTTATGIADFTAALADPDKAKVASYIASNFIPIGEANSDVDYGAWSAAGTNGVLAIKPNATPTGTEPTNSMTVSGTLANSNWTTSAANSADVTGIPRGTRLFLLVYNNADIAQADALGIYSGTAWVTNTNTLVTTANLSLSSVDDAAGTGVTTEYFRGSKGSLVLGDFSSVPEPAAGILLLLGLAGGMRRRR